MSVAYYSEFRDATQDTAQQVSDYVIERLGGPFIAPDGGLFHAEGATPDGNWWTFDIWESEDHFARFREDVLAGAVAHAGIELPTCTPLQVAWDSTQTPATSAD
jgi:hypothetical protein